MGKKKVQRATPSLRIKASAFEDRGKAVLALQNSLSRAIVVVYEDDTVVGTVMVVCRNGFPERALGDIRGLFYLPGKFEADERGNEGYWRMKLQGHGSKEDVAKTINTANVWV